MKVLDRTSTVTPDRTRLGVVVLQCVMHNVSQSEMEEGQQQFVMYGAEYEKNRCSQLIKMWEKTYHTSSKTKFRRNSDGNFFGRQPT